MLTKLLHLEFFIIKLAKFSFTTKIIGKEWFHLRKFSQGAQKVMLETSTALAVKAQMTAWSFKIVEFYAQSGYRSTIKVENSIENYFEYRKKPL